MSRSLCLILSDAVPDSPPAVRNMGDVAEAQAVRAAMKAIDEQQRDCDAMHSTVTETMGSLEQRIASWLEEGKRLRAESTRT